MLRSSRHIHRTPRTAPPPRTPRYRRAARPGLLLAACATAVGLVVGSAAVPAAAAGRPAPDPTARHYNAEQVHHFLEGFYGNHGPRPWEREHLVDDHLKEKAAQTPGYDLLLCAQNTPEDIEVGPVTTAQSAGVGWAPVTTHWADGPEVQVFTAYVALDASQPIKLTDISCKWPDD